MFLIDVFMTINTFLMSWVIDPLNAKRQRRVRGLQYQCAKLPRMGAFDALLRCGIWWISALGAPIEDLETELG